MVVPLVPLHASGVQAKAVPGWMRPTNWPRLLMPKTEPGNEVETISSAEPVLPRAAVGAQRMATL